ncbi:glycerophosphodiester phosphodiesterase family protein [Tunturiibacter gelidiferens]|uniref:glycerophosphodiester phosphodiesterase family protein n=1 Tax=Tunturiibacter gelidiferens TaxID=3069689 RepID=UPI003D9B76A6
MNVAELHKAGFKVVPWTTNDPAKMRALIGLRVDGIISDRPDLLQQVVKEEAAAHPDEAAYFKSFDVSAHRGGRGLRPENTLPSFEDGLDHLSTTLETDTGVTTDHVSLIWHDQFLSPESCRRVDGTPYTLENRVYTRDISLAEAQSTFICDKLHPQFPDQKNDLALSPVAVAFAAQEHLISPYVPTHAEQLFRFTRFYAEYYRSGAGKSHPDAAARAANAEKVRFNLETKILPLPNDPTGPNPPLANAHAEPTSNHTVAPQTFVNTLCGTIVRNHMESRAEVQSFDFRTLILVEEQFPKIPTYYLTESPKMLSLEFVPVALRQ